jgi:thiamine pyrophosphate-dependent acetolactate synthase large subunit-like protein
MMDRLDANRVVAAHLTDELVVTGLGNASYDLFQASDRPENFYTWGSMGTAISVGLGLALAQPERRVLVLEGDGAMLMGLSGLIGVGRLTPRNLACVVWDNQRLGLTGGQPSPTGGVADLAAVGRGLGFVQSSKVESLEELRSALDQAWARPGPSLIVARVGPQASGVKPPRRPAVIKHRFMRAIGTLTPDEQMVFD